MKGRHLLAGIVFMMIPGLLVHAFPPGEYDSLVSELVILGAVEQSRTGHSVAMGDVNGDGLADLVVGTNSLGARGGAYVFLGPHLPMGTYSLQTARPDLMFLGAADGDALGAAVGVADFNGDGIGDILLGAPGADVGRRKDCGAVYVIAGGALPRGITVDFSYGIPAYLSSTVLIGPTEYDTLGSDLAGGDLDGDGYEDLIIASAGCSNLRDGTARGAVFAVAGRAKPPATLDLLTASNRMISLFNPDPLDGVGMRVTTGDINGDGLDDLIAGTGFSGPEFADGFKGRVNVLFGQRGAANRTVDLASGRADLTFFGSHMHDALGVAVASGDINGDGIDDLLLGAKSQRGRQADSGLVHVYFGRRTFRRGESFQIATHPADVRIHGEKEEDAFGSSLAVGNVDGTGPDDVIIGAYGARMTHEQEGALYVLRGRREWRQDVFAAEAWQTQGVRIRGGESLRFGYSLATGDVDGDGRDDILAGAPMAHHPAAAFVGKAFLITAQKLNPITGIHSEEWSAFQ